MYYRTILAIFTVLVTLTASAEDYVLNIGQNVLKGMQSAHCVFIPEEDGRVLIEAQEVFSVSYANKAYEHQYVPGGGFPYTYEIAEVKAGTNVTVSSDFIWNSTSVVKVSLFTNGTSVPVEALNIVPKLNEVFTWTGTGMITVNFNKTVTLSKIKFVAGEYEADVDDVRIGSSVSCNVSNALNEALKKEILKPGDTFGVKISGLRDANDASNLYAGSGEMLLTYIAPAPQHNFVSAKVGETPLSYKEANEYQFLSYYSPNEEDGLFVIEFDGEVGKVGEVYMTMGNLDLESQGKYYRASLPYTVQGNKLIVDARGKLRTLALLFPAIIEDESEEGAAGDDMYGGFDTEHVTLGVTNVLDVNGNPFLCDVSGSVGSYYFVLGYKELFDEAYIDGDNVVDGDAVSEGQEISLWLSNADIKFDGLSISYFVKTISETDGAEAQEARTVVVKDFTMVPDAVEGVIVTFKMPEMPGVFAGSTIRVSLNNAESADGMPHYLYIEFKATGTETGVQAVVTAGSASKVYRLNGIMEGKAQAGRIVIKNGKKIIK